MHTSIVLQVVDSQSEAKDSSADSEAGGLDISENLQDELCKLWDMSMNSVSPVIIMS